MRTQHQQCPDITPCDPPAPFSTIEEQLRVQSDMLALANDAIIAFDPSLKVIHWNAAAEKIYGWSAAEAMGKTFDDVLRPLDDPEYRRTRLTRYAQGEIIRAEYTHHRKDGSPIWVEATARAILDRNNIIAGYVTVIRNITERKNAEEKLRRAYDGLELRIQERTARLLEQTRILEAFFQHTQTCLVFLDRDFNFVRVNDAYARVCARPPADFIGRNHFIDYPSDDLREKFRNVVETGEPYSAYGRAFVFPDHPEWGTTYWDLSVAPITGVDGAVELLIFSLLDVTERVRTEDASLRLAAVVETAADAVVITDPDRGMIQYVNAAFEQMTGYSRSEVLGCTLHFLDSGNHDESFYQEMRNALARDGQWHGRLVNRKKDGTLYFEDCTSSVVRDIEGKTIGYASIKRDVTEKLKLEAVAEAVTTLNNIGAIFGGLRHEIGNPVNSAKSILTVLKRKLSVQPAVRSLEFVDRALAELGRVERLLHLFKSYTLFETPDIQDVDTALFLLEFERLITMDFMAKGISLSRRIDPGAEKLRADPRALQQVLLNIATNAADALSDRPSPRIAVSASRRADRVVISVFDNGAGMTEQQVAALFKPFTTSKPGGTGLGLVIVRKLLTSMQGEIEITSLPGQGTTVEISLPAVADVQ